MSFPNTYRQVMRMSSESSASYAWIALHRLVEAYARTFGLRFNGVFADLESRLGKAFFVSANGTLGMAITGYDA